MTEFKVLIILSILDLQLRAIAVPGMLFLGYKAYKLLKVCAAMEEEKA